MIQTFRVIVRERLDSGEISTRPLDTVTREFVQEQTNEDLLLGVLSEVNLNEELHMYQWRGHTFRESRFEGLSVEIVSVSQ